MRKAKDIYCSFCTYTQPCKEWNSYEEISISGDHRVRYKALIPLRSNAAAFTVDGGLLPIDLNNRKCDKTLLIERPDGFCHACFIEMKSGNDISRAASQLIATLNDPFFKADQFHTRKGIIVSGSMPKNKPGGEWARTQYKFKRLTGCDLRRVRQNCPDKIVF